MNCKVLLIFLLLSSVAIPDILVTPTKEFVFTKFGVFLFTGKLLSRTFDKASLYTANVYGATQEDFFNWMVRSWCGGPNGVMTLAHFNELSKVYVPWETKEEERIREACEVLGISKTQWQDWRVNGELRTEAEIQAAKEAEEQKRIAEAVAQISQIKFYLSPDGFWHTTKDCLDCTNAIEVNPFDVMKIPGVKSCPKCGVK